MGCEEYHSEHTTNINCAKGSKLSNVSFQSTLVLNKNFIEDKQVFQRAAKKQIQYMAGQFYNNEMGFHKHVISTDIEIKVLSKKERKYPFNLKIDNLVTKKVELFEPYILKAIKKGQTKSQDEAVEVKYQAKLKVASCALKNEPVNLEQVQLNLPLDPFLIYWAVPKKDREKTTWRNVSTDYINPCSISELADYNSPGYYWYFWKTDKNAKKFNCHKYLTKNKYINKVKLLVKKSKLTSSVRETNLSKSKKIAIIYGHLNHYQKPKSLNDFVVFLENDFLPKNYKKILTSDEISFFNFIRNLKSFLVLKNKRFLIKEDSIITSIIDEKGRSFEIFFGPTDTFDKQKEAKHWKFFLKALKEKELILYWGHSGLGENLKISNLMKSLGEKKIQLGDQFKGIVYLGCYTYSYFGDELRKLLNKKATFVYTGTAIIDGYRVMAGVLKDLFFPTLKKLTRKKDFLIFERI